MCIRITKFAAQRGPDAVPSRPGTGDHDGEYSGELLSHGGQAVSPLEYLTTARFWFESFQNWQSEFLAVFAIVVLSIFLRQRGSAESKPVAAPHRATG